MLADLTLKTKKMSKSIGNIILVKDLLEAYEYQSFRLLILSHHYRQPINYSEALMSQFDSEWQRIKRALKQAFIEVNVNKYQTNTINEAAMKIYNEAMQDDFNISNAMTVVYDQIKAMNRSKDFKEIAILLNTVTLMLKLLGITMDLVPLTENQIEKIYGLAIG